MLGFRRFCATARKGRFFLPRSSPDHDVKNQIPNNIKRFASCDPAQAAHVRRFAGLPRRFAADAREPLAYIRLLVYVTLIEVLNEPY
jgi:hypothetical protein